MRVLLIGSASGRLDCLAEAIVNSGRVHLFVLTNYTNHSLQSKGLVTVGPITPDFVANWASLIARSETMAIISDEAPLAAGVVDRLIAMGIPTLGPTQALARIETSKTYARNLLEHYQIPGNPLWGAFGPHSHPRDVRDWMHALGEFVVKPDGLSGGKGVQVFGDHFDTLEDGFAYAMSLGPDANFLVEEKLIGEEFSLMSFCGDECIPSFPIQDHKRLLEDDAGPNTGGMGSYGCAAFTGAPGVEAQDIELAIETNTKVAQALFYDNNRQPYRGILYGNYMVTQKGLRVIEFNARFGDPEVMNLLPVLQMDFVGLAWKMANGQLTEGDSLWFSDKFSVCKYLVPEGYPDSPVTGVPIDLSGVEGHDGLRIYYAGLDVLNLTGSRAVAMVGFADSLTEAEQIAETACQQARGPLYHRTDIGTIGLIERRRNRS